MSFDLSLIPLFLGLGVLTGFLSALLGIGGGIIYVPVLTFALPLLLGVNDDAIRIAIATSLLVVFLTAISSSVANVRARNVDYRLLKRALAAGLIGAFVGSQFGSHLPAEVLRVAFGLLQFYVGYRLIRAIGRREYAEGEEDIAWRKVIPISGFTGVITSTFGIGGGLFSVPAFNQFCRVPLRKCVGTSSNLIFFNAMMGVAGYVVGQTITGLPLIRYDIAFTIAIGAMAAAPLGIRFLGRVNLDLLRRVFALLVFASALNLLLGAL
ncbi:sulfite exporter TauE/SafE family protein [Desulfurispira natronophila]|uniref:Probable membrane transporter protein n=1 Tax=Desulfurispira natronophila TaxID=682562 RepID=A0A7W7Y512_9BACT|nr:sulfite exporter TauE/SafE family protein [Desulfurispira natronophila]MBB5022228.1 hypothetical protein [Desulfurispira natronophila]